MSARADIAVFQNARDQVGESPLWDPVAGCLWWVDVLGRRIHRAAVAGGERETYAMSDPPGALALADDGTLIVAAGLAWHRFEPASRKLERIVNCGAQGGKLRLNDGVVDAQGRFWTGTLHDARDPVGELLCLDGTVVRSAVGGLRTQNGCAISPDGRTFYLADSHPDLRTIWAYDFDVETGALQNRRVFHRPAHGRPDGAAIDADGCYWFADVDGGRVVQLDPDGTAMRSVALPVSRPTKPAFGAPDLSVIYVTSMSVGTDPAREPLAGAVFAIDAGVRGLSQPRVATHPTLASAGAGKLESC
jgi:sugar lactone lactonase YvrE